MLVCSEFGEAFVNQDWPDGRRCKLATLTAVPVHPRKTMHAYTTSVMP